MAKDSAHPSFICVVREAVSVLGEGISVDRGFIEACLAELMYLYFMKSRIEDPTEKDVKAFRDLLRWDQQYFSSECMWSAFEKCKPKMTVKGTNKIDRPGVYFSQLESLVSCIERFKEAVQDLRDTRDVVFSELGIQCEDYTRHE